MSETVMSRAVERLQPLLPHRFRSGVATVPVVRLGGIIGFSTPLRPGLTLATCAKALDRAFTAYKATAVALAINSPGGSAAQSHLIFKRIRQLSAEKQIPVIAFVEDVAASGGYMIACAADEIVADESSIVGSIGVVGATFGFDKLLEKIGVERRIHTAGDNKVILDPFLPEKPEDVARLKAIQQDIHASFIALVKDRRGGELADDPDLFTGAYWTGRRGEQLGLVDRIGDLRSVLRERYGDKVAMPLVSAGRGLFGRATPGVGLGLGARSQAFPGVTGLADDFVSALEARAIWSRYGL